MTTTPQPGTHVDESAPVRRPSQMAKSNQAIPLAVLGLVLFFGGGVLAANGSPAGFLFGLLGLGILITAVVVQLRR